MFDGMYFNQNTIRFEDFIIKIKHLLVKKKLWFTTHNNKRYIIKASKLDKFSYLNENKKNILARRQPLALGEIKIDLKGLIAPFVKFYSIAISI